MAGWAFGIVSTLAVFAGVGQSRMVKVGNKCTVYPQGASDDTPSIRQAFAECGTNGIVDFPEGQIYHVDKVLNTTGLRSCTIHVRGRLEWSKDTDYWLENSYQLEYQDQSTAWLFGGKNVSMYGHKKGVFDGNGQTWYDQNRNRANQPGRPIAMTITESDDLSIDGISFVQSQFWSNFIIYSKNVRMTNINVKSVSHSEWGTVNTDGTNTWNADNVLFENWVVENGDDCVAIKGNSTNVVARNITCIGSGDGGLPIGSIGQYKNKADYISNITFTNIHLEGINRGLWIKTWPGVVRHGDANGDDGGGGKGYVKNVVWENVRMDGVNMPVFVTQCTYVDDSGVCDTSKLHLEDITWRNITGTSNYNLIASLHCSKASPCPGFRFEDVNVKPAHPDVHYPKVYQCANIIGRNTTDTNIPCNGYAPASFQGQVNGNVPNPKKGEHGKAATASRDQVKKSGVVARSFGYFDVGLFWGLASLWFTERLWETLRELFEA